MHDWRPHPPVRFQELIANSGNCSRCDSTATQLNHAEGFMTSFVRKRNRFFFLILTPLLAWWQNFFRAMRKQPELFSEPVSASHYRLSMTLDYAHDCIRLVWTDVRSNSQAGELRVLRTGLDELTWELARPGAALSLQKCSHHRTSIRAKVNSFRRSFPTAEDAIHYGMVKCEQSGAKLKAGPGERLALPSGLTPWECLENHIVEMAEMLRGQFSPLARVLDELAPDVLDRELRRMARLDERERWKAAEADRRMREAQRQREERARRREATRQREANRPLRAAEKVAPPVNAAPPARERPPVPPVPLAIDLSPLQFQETMLPLADMRSYSLVERAALWWVSNQSDDLLALPYCRIERLEYQIRTALRVIGPLRGRALLSDEVGLGKTIETGLVLKEYLTRGMIKRFLVLTVPSLVDQWEEELEDKFQIATATTNHASFRADPAAFWRENHGIVASLHTLKQPAHLAVAQTLTWDLLVIDEAHYLRNRASQAWTAVNALPRQFLLLLTATPVQNSLEELYNLVTLLQPGQLPSPKEFRERFIDKQRPHQPREPEELRRLLGQVMIRNTRANAGVQLPPRRAETVLFEPEEAERQFWERWEKEFRQSLSQLSASQSSLWGRLLLQAVGSSSAAWRGALESFPDAASAQAWRDQAQPDSSWKKKCDLLVPLTKGEGGVVIFTQFLLTQAALAEHLNAANVQTLVVNGQTPVPSRQPLIEQFRRQGGALLLTHSGTEGRNLQFSHRLVNFDLPWNPMEIEQRIGRLHRLGQQHPVRIYNLVQAHSLQEHLLEILQEKLNLFELVVGETGLILGDRFSSDEFAEEVFRRWRDSEGRVAESIQSLGEELAAARDSYQEVKKIDETLFAKDYESL